MTEEKLAPALRNRREEMASCELMPDTLVGSWFHKLEVPSGAYQPEMVWQGIVVAEPQAGVYLLDIENYGQRLVSLPQILAEDWHFYDTDEAMRLAYTIHYQREDA